MATPRDDRDWERLARAAKEQRAILGDPPSTKIVDNAGTWRRLVYHLETDPEKREKAGPLSARTLRQLERGLGWGVGAADAVLAGGDPWLAADEPELPDRAEGVWVLYKGGEVRALLPGDPERDPRLIDFIRRHGKVVEMEG